MRALHVQIKIKWIKRKQMTHENTYRDDSCKQKKKNSFILVYFNYLFISCIQKK